MKQVNLHPLVADNDREGPKVLPGEFHTFGATLLVKSVKDTSLCVNKLEWIQ